MATERVRIIPFRWRWWERAFHWMTRGRWLPYRTVSKIEGVFLQSSGYLYGIRLNLGEPQRVKFIVGDDTVFEEDAPWDPPKE